MASPPEQRAYYWIAVFVPPVFLLGLGSGLWLFAYFFGFLGGPGPFSPYLLPALPGLAAGWLTGWVARLARKTWRGELHYILSVLATIFLLATYGWWVESGVEFARWLNV